MRLLHTTTLEFVEFFNPLPYAILSHRWGDAEVSYDDFLHHRKLDGEGHRKVIDCCVLAKSRGLDYVWIDTCCIDKRSSAELSESINSMWQWYSQAKECYAYLVDVDSAATSQNQPFESRPYKSSAWFSRGWTLQELLAPRIVIFFDFAWRRIGEKLDASILSELTRITSIPEDCLVSHFSLSNACVAKKFSWAATRVTTRPEDAAYSLLGLIGINMPLLYGEGTKAFFRLQQEIIRQTNDESVFVWVDLHANDEYSCGVLARDIAAFAYSCDGLDLYASARMVYGDPVFIIPLNCEYGRAVATRQRAIALTEVRGRYSRIATADLGDHLNVLYPPPERPSEVPQRFIVRLQRWDSEYEPAMVVLKSKIQRLLKLRAVRLDEQEAGQVEQAA
ncbi:hypothetical protein LTR95_005627 [Oleoguttula sp. CCFEE 5521]